MVRRLAHAAVAGLAGAGLALYGATRVWSVEVTPRPGLSDLRTSTTGADAQPWLIALALIALAGPGALLATRGPVRRLLGGLIALVGLGVAITAIVGRAGTDPGAAGAGATVWPIACVAGGALVVLTGVGAARHGHEWPAMGSRYERRPVPPPRAGSIAGSGPSPATGPGPSAAAGSGPSAAAGSGPSAAAGSGPSAAAGSGPSPAAGPTESPTPATDRIDGSPAAARDGRPGDGPIPAGDPAAPIDTRAVWDALDRGDDPTTR